MGDAGPVAANGNIILDHLHRNGSSTVFSLMESTSLRHHWKRLLHARVLGPDRHITTSFIVSLMGPPFNRRWWSFTRSSLHAVQSDPSPAMFGA